MLTVIVVDDEPLARRRIGRLVEETGEATVVAACAGGRAAVEKTRELKPDLLFLDVQMPDLDGFAVIDEIGREAIPAVVFVTAFDQYALRAFGVHAVDYLLKPYDTPRFLEAFERAKARVASRDRTEDVSHLYAAVRAYLSDARRESESRGIERIAVSAQGTTRFVKPADVEWCETDGNYLRLHVGKTSHLIRSTANKLEEQLDPRQFVRIHRRYIVNIDRIVEVQPWFSGDAVVVMQSGARVRMSRSYRDRLHSRLLGTGKTE
jgi:two-component system LytT family response regulator